MSTLRSARPVVSRLAGISAAGLSCCLAATALAAPPLPPDAVADPAAAAPPMTEVTVTAKRLDEARIGIEPQIGASTYTITNQDIQNLPGGENAPLNEVLLHAPGVDQDSLGFGAIHIRNEHLNVQYRIDGVALPDGVSFFGQGLSPRFAQSLQLLTGALPAEYGLRTAGIVDIQMKSGLFQPGGSVGLYGGSYGTLESSGEYGGSVDGYNYFVAGDNLLSSHGINAVTPSYNAIHDDTLQTHAFLYLDKIIDASSKLSLIAGTFDGQFQLPNNPGQPTFPGITTINGSPVANYDSGKLSEHQTESDSYGILSYLHAEEDFDFQVSAFTKYSSLHYHPDLFGDLAFNGIAQYALRQSFANGLQADGSYKLGGGHTLRGGVLLSAERSSADISSWVLPQTGVDGGGNAIYGNTPENIVDDSAKTGWSYSAYLQDEWKITPTVTLNYGGRFDVINAYTDENQLSPRVNAVWQATPATVFHAGYANYFTPPPLELLSSATVNQFLNTSGATPSTENAPVKAERAQYFDAGVTQQVLPGLKLGLDLYYKYARNLIDEGQFGAPVILTVFNYHTGFNRGVELTTSYEAGRFSYYGNLAIAQQKAEGIDSAQYNFSPADLAYVASHLVNTDHSQRMTATAGVSYLLSGTRYSLDLIAGSGLRCQCSAGDNYNEGTGPSYEQVNLGVSHRFADAPGGPLEVRFDIVNLLDEDYLLRPQTGVGVFAPQYGPRRSFFVGIKKEF